jgi:hypothetical protein
MSDINELYAHDVEVYGDNAYLRWEWNLKDVQTHDFYNNNEIFAMLSLDNTFDFKVMRKTSA